MIEKLKKGIENLEEDFYEEIKINNEEIIEERIKELEDYFIQLEFEWEYEQYLIQLEIDENYFDKYEK